MILPKTIYLPLDEEVTLLPRIPVEDFLESVIRPDVSLTRLTPWINAPLIKAGTLVMDTLQYTLVAKDDFLPNGAHGDSYTVLGVIDLEKQTFRPLASKVILKCGLVMTFKDTN